MRLGFTCTLRCYTPSLFDTFNTFNTFKWCIMPSYKSIATKFAMNFNWEWILLVEWDRGELCKIWGWSSIQIRWQFDPNSNTMVAANVCTCCTAQLVWNVQIFATIWWPGIELQQNEVYIEFQMRAKTVKPWNESRQIFKPADRTTVF